MKVFRTVSIPEAEIDYHAIRSQGPGGQNVNKVSSAIQLFFNIPQSSLREEIKERLLKLKNNRITAEGVIVIKAQSYRSQEKNKEEARHRLAELVRSALKAPKKRRATKQSRASTQKRLDSKKRRSENKNLRRRVNPD
ncbi:MAG: class I peptide chain release factor [Opitutaceae bacterium]|nr:class I peptide chain release factor [Opitutaceae bacterium]